MGNINLDIVQQHFSEMNKDTKNTTENIDDLQNMGQNDTINIPFTCDEISKHISSLKNNKSPGIDNILNEFIKYLLIGLLE